MKKTLYLMRHGQTLFNLQHKIQGWCDAPLTQLGIEQAKIAGKYFKDNNITFDHAYSSTSERASDTLEIVTEGKMPYTRSKKLKEWNFGSFEGKDEFLNPKFPYGDFFVQFGGEGEQEFQDRISQALLEIMQKEDHHVVLVASHGAVCGSFMRKWLATSKVEYKAGIGNCAIYKYEFEDDVFTCVDIIKHDFSHLFNDVIGK